MSMTTGFMLMKDGFMLMKDGFMLMKDGFHGEWPGFLEEKAVVTFPPPTGWAPTPVPRPLPATFGRLPRRVMRREPGSFRRDGRIY
jgi:hypothetical protein